MPTYTFAFPPVPQPQVKRKRRKRKRKRNWNRQGRCQVYKDMQSYDISANDDSYDCLFYNKFKSLMIYHQ